MGKHTVVANGFDVAFWRAFMQDAGDAALLHGA